MIVKSKLNGNIKATNKISKRDYLRRQQIEKRYFLGNTAPFNVSSPFNEGGDQTGQTAEANNGQWSSSEPITYEYQWQLDGLDIVGATLKTLLIIPSMIGKKIRCLVKAINSFGFTIAYTAYIEINI